MCRRARQAQCATTSAACTPPRRSQSTIVFDRVFCLPANWPFTARARPTRKCLGSQPQDTAGQTPRPIRPPAMKGIMDFSSRNHRGGWTPSSNPLRRLSEAVRRARPPFYPGLPFYPRLPFCPRLHFYLRLPYYLGALSRLAVLSKLDPQRKTTHVQPCAATHSKVFWICLAG